MLTPEQEALRDEYARRIWGQVAERYPLFTREYDTFGDPWMVENLVLDNEYIGFQPFQNARVMDVGANAGIWTAFCAVGGAQVTAYEADPITFEVLRGMLERNGLTERVRAINSAIWTYSGECAFLGSGGTGSEKCAYRNGALQVVGAGEHSSGDMTPGKFRGNAPAITPDMGKVKCISFEETLGDSTWDFVKMDIEGAEYQVILSTPSEVLRTRIKAMHIELHGGWADKEVNDALVAKLEDIFHLTGTKDQYPESELFGRWNWLRLQNKTQ